MGSRQYEPGYDVRGESLVLRDRYSGGKIYLTVRNGVVVGAMGSDPARYVGMPIATARYYARHGGRKHERR
jgi:hypothetical protein